jgi:hypothetical protein
MTKAKEPQIIYIRKDGVQECTSNSIVQTAIDLLQRVMDGEVELYMNDAKYHNTKALIEWLKEQKEESSGGWLYAMETVIAHLEGEGGGVR